MADYQIADEPAPSRFARYAVNPIFPLLAAMLAGAWLAWPWFAFNGYAIGSPTRRAELAWLVAGIVVPPTLGIALFMAGPGGLGWWSAGAAPYIWTSVVVAKLVVLYAVFLLQSRTIEIYEYYSGKLVNGIPVLLVGYLLHGWTAELPVLLQIVLS